VLARLRILVASSIFDVGSKVPVQLTPSLEAITESTPFSTVISSALLKPATGSEKTRLTVAVSPLISA
jgi:hypothetical protein